MTSVRNLARTFLVCSAPYNWSEDDFEHQLEMERQDTETIVRILIAVLYAVKHNLRSEWRSSATPTPIPSRASTFGTFSFPPTSPTPSRHHSRKPSAKRPRLFRNESGTSIFQGSGLPQSFYADRENESHSPRDDQPPKTPTAAEDLRRSAMLNVSHVDSGLGNMSSSASTIFNFPERQHFGHRTIKYGGLLPSNLGDFEDQGLSLPIQLSVLVEAYIHRQVKRGRLTPPQAASQVGPQLNTLIDAFGKMETIRTTPLPVAHHIHTKQVLMLYLLVLPFTMVAEMSWWAVPIVSLVAFTLYGIDAIGKQLEDPFGYDRNDVKMDGIVEDARVEGMVLLAEWRRGGEMFAPHPV